MPYNPTNNPRFNALPMVHSNCGKCYKPPVPGESMVGGICDKCHKVIADSPLNRPCKICGHYHRSQESWDICHDGRRLAVVNV